MLSAALLTTHGSSLDARVRGQQYGETHRELVRNTSIVQSELVFKSFGLNDLYARQLPSLVILHIDPSVSQSPSCRMSSASAFTVVVC